LNVGTIIRSALRAIGLVAVTSGAAAVALVTLLAAQPAPAADNAAPVRLQALRGGAHVQQDIAPSGARQERDRAPHERDFVQQPPLIPHTITGYNITRNFNKCMDCHAWSKTRESGATKVSLTHFRDREGQELDNVSPRRYFCTQCHVAQTDARPLVGNDFVRARGMK
jgi:cytochrome c-type protein NapB